VLKRMTGATGRSFLVATLFALHPLRVESVAWVAERKDVLSATFWLLTLWAYARYAESQVQNSSRSKRDKIQYYLLALLFFILGLMAKPMLVTLPFVLLLLDYWPLRRFQLSNNSQRSRGRESARSPPQAGSTPATASGCEKGNLGRALRPLLLEKLPFLAAAFAASVITFAVQQRGGAMSAAAPLIPRVENALVAYCRYLRKLFYPNDLAVFYPPSHWPLVLVVLAALILLAISVVAVWHRIQRPYVLVGWLWFLGVLVPVIGLVQVGQQSMADRYSYLPSIGLLLVLVWAGHEFLNALPSRSSRLLGAVSLGTTAALACIVLTRQQIRYWNTTENLSRRAIAVTENNFLAHHNLGTALEKQDRLDEAQREFQEALREKPDYPEVHNNLGVVFNKQGRLQEAMAQYLEALKQKPAYADPHNNLGVTLEKLGRFGEAATQYQEAIKLNPNYADAHYNLAIALSRQGRVDDAIQELHAVLALQPNSADAHNNLGVVLERKGQLDEALTHYFAAVKLSPGHSRAHFNLGGALVKKGLLDAAINELQTALRLQPDYPEAEQNLNAVLALKNARSRTPNPSKP